MLLHLLDLVAPPRCAGCGTGAVPSTAPLCGACRRELPWLGPACPRCALPLPCGSPCPAARASFAAAWAPVAYAGPARALVRALKYDGARPVARRLAAQLAALAPAAVLGAGGRGPALVAVPCHPARRRARGYDQAVLLARALAQRTGRELAAPLRRGGRAGDRQAGSSRATRLGAGRVTFTVRGRAPGAVVLVDDVHTTGATLHAAASALRAAGTERVTALTWARTLDDG